MHGRPHVNSENHVRHTRTEFGQEPCDRSSSETPPRTPDIAHSLSAPLAVAAESPPLRLARCTRKVGCGVAGAGVAGAVDESGRGPRPCARRAAQEPATRPTPQHWSWTGPGRLPACLPGAWRAHGVLHRAVWTAQQRAAMNASPRPRRGLPLANRGFQEGVNARLHGPARRKLRCGGGCTHDTMSSRCDASLPPLNSCAWRCTAYSFQNTSGTSDAS